MPEGAAIIPDGVPVVPEDSKVVDVIPVVVPEPLATPPAALLAYRQSLCELDLYMLNQRLVSDKYYQNAFRIDMTTQLKQKIDFAKSCGMNLIFLFYGLPGTSKSYSALSLARAIDPQFDVNKSCYWDLRKFIDDLPNLRNKGCYVIDEVARNWGEGSFRVLSEINTVFETVRKRQIFIIVCTPRYFFSPTWSYCLEGIPGQISFALEKSRMALQTGDRKTLGYILFNSPLRTLGKEQIDQYEVMKDGFLDEVLHKGGGWFESKANEVAEGQMFINYMEQCKTNKIMPSQRGLMVCVNEIFPYLKFNNECSRISEIILTWFEMGKYGDMSDFKSARGRRGGSNSGRVMGEDKMYVR
jgi:DNA polymerase III delta prime subunit